MEEVLFGRETPERGVEPGLLEHADGGVLFFDEVADMPEGTQGKILRVLTEQTFLRVGGAEQGSRRSARHFQHQPQSGRGSAGGPVPQRAVPSAQRGADRGAVAGRTA